MADQMGDVGVIGGEFAAQALGELWCCAGVEVLVCSAGVWGVTGGAEVFTHGCLISPLILDIVLKASIPRTSLNRIPVTRSMPARIASWPSDHRWAVGHVVEHIH